MITIFVLITKLVLTIILTLKKQTMLTIIGILLLTTDILTILLKSTLKTAPILNWFTTKRSIQTTIVG